MNALEKAIFIIFLITFIILSISVHEIMHLKIAQKYGVNTNRIEIGKGPVIYKLKRKDCNISFHLLPFQGFCQFDDNFNKIPGLNQIKIFLSAPIFEILISGVLFFLYATTLYFDCNIYVSTFFQIIAAFSLLNGLMNLLPIIPTNDGWNAVIAYIKIKREKVNYDVVKNIGTCFLVIWGIIILLSYCSMVNLFT